MNDKESTKDIIQRFKVIVNDFGILGRKFENVDLVHKILRLLTIEC